MADRGAGAKLRIYQTMYRLNLSFANIVAHCRVLGASGMLTREYAHLYQSFAQELQAQINEEVVVMLESVEGDDTFRFGKVRQAWEKQLRDPNDVFIQAEERRKEIARQRGKRRPTALSKISAAAAGGKRTRTGTEASRGKPR